jgi:gliding motility-associated-like protein
MVKPLLRLLPIFLLALLSPKVYAQFPYTESFTNSTANGIKFGGEPSAFLTAAPNSSMSGTSIDPVGSGFLRLTNATNNQKGYAYNSIAEFPSSEGLKVEFEYFIYGGSGADGISFFLFDASVSQFVIGGFGGSLGYAQITTTNPISPGVSKGYLAVGLDEFGNFSNSNEGRQGGPGQLEGSVTLRGKGNGNALTTDNYPFLVTKQSGSLGVPLVGDRTRRVTDPTQTGYRKVAIELIPNKLGYNVNVYITKGGTPQVKTKVIDNYYYSEPAPANLRYGFASSTGAQTNFHEIRNVSIDLYKPSPVAVDDTARTLVNTAVTIPVLNNDTYSGTAILDKRKVEVKTPPANGTQSISPAGEIVYTPNDGFQGFDSLTYTVTDIKGEVSNIATVTVTVLPEPGKAPDIVIGNNAGKPLPIPIQLPSGGSINIVKQPDHGIISFDPVTGLPIYTSNPNYSGQDNFTYIIIDADGHPSKSPGIVTIFVESAAKIGLAKELLSNVKNTDGSYTLNYSFKVVNIGDVTVQQLSLNDDLNEAFPGALFEVNRLNASGNLFVNTNYNGTTNKELLSNTSYLEADSAAFITLEVKVTLTDQDGVFNNLAYIQGISANDGSKVFDTSTNGKIPDFKVAGDFSPKVPTPATLIKNPLFIPKGFSPNNDGINDAFVVENANGRQILLEVYNRWGNRIYHSKDYKNNWSGKTTEGIHVGDEVPVGTYYYVVVVGNKEKYVGYITINR